MLPITRGLPGSAEVLADQGLAYMAFKQALIFRFGSHLFDALTTMLIQPQVSQGDEHFLLNVVGRPVRVNSQDSAKVYALSIETYQKACEVYEKVSAEVTERVLQLSQPQEIDKDYE